MIYSLTLPKTDTGVILNCNDEVGVFSGDKVVPFWSALNLVLSGHTQSPQETKFLETWLADGFLPPNAKILMLAEKPMGGGAVAPREFKEIIRKYRPKLREASERATLYKHFFAAALHSSRDMDQLVLMMASAQECLEIDFLLRAFISDALANALPAIPYRFHLISQEEKEIILAVIFVALNIDSQKHILELNACRVIMAALSMTVVNNTTLGTLSRKPIPELLSHLTNAALPVVFVNSLRMAVADERVSGDEKQLVRTVAAILPADQVKVLHRMVMLECGKVFQI